MVDGNDLRAGANPWYPSSMNLEEIKAELARMPTDQQDHLAAYLVHLRHRRDSVHRQETAAMDDRNSGNWISLDQLKEKWKD